MKIPLNMGPKDPNAQKAFDARVLEADILAAKKGDWNAKNSLVRQFMPLLQSLAEKRASDTSQINVYIEAGKVGLLVAAKKYKSDVGPANFQIFALDFIESRMDKASQGGGGFLGRLFGK